MAAAEGLLSSLERLNLAEKSAIALEKVEENYILDVAVQNKYVCPFVWKHTQILIKTLLFICIWFVECYDVIAIEYDMLVIPIPFVFNAILLDASYCIKSCRPGVHKLIAATSSNHEIRLYQCANLSMTSKLKGIYINVHEHKHYL